MVRKQVFGTLSFWLVLVLTVSMAGSKASSVAITEPECEGNGCAVVTLTWEEERQQFRVKNNSDRPVRVEVSTFAGKSHIIVPPQKSGYLEVKTFNGPYHANYE